MKSSHVTKVLVVCFSATLAGCMVWRMSDSMQPKSDSATDHENPQGAQRAGDGSMIPGTKNPNRIDMEIGGKGKPTNPRPLLPGSKSSTAGLRSGDFGTTKHSVDDILKKQKKEQKKTKRPLLPSSKWIPYSSE